MATPNYQTTANRSTDGINYLFTSQGNTDILKSVEYSYVRGLNGWCIYNLGFGDYSKENASTNDTVNSKNGDVYKVFNTVLNTIPEFFNLIDNAIIHIQGSDSGTDFVDKCRLNCKKNCAETCKNQHRRILAYCHYLDKNYDELKKEYEFYGGWINHSHQTPIEIYIPKKKYDLVWIVKRNITETYES